MYTNVLKLVGMIERTKKEQEEQIYEYEREQRRRNSHYQIAAYV